MSKPINWVGSALKDLCDFPDDARQVAGQQLRRVQEGENPDHYKPMSDVGGGVHEIIVNTADAWFRVMYVAKFEEAVYVLHSFQKKTNRTAQSDLDTAKRRYKAVIAERKANEQQKKR
jgi:phage-related protein